MHLGLHYYTVCKNGYITYISNLCDSDWDNSLCNGHTLTRHLSDRSPRSNKDFDVYHSGIMQNPSLKNLELTLTPLLARALDRFLFPDNILHKGACLHRLPVSCNNQTHSAERPDFYILELADAIPQTPIGVSDFKKDSLEKAHNESFAYATRLIENSNQGEMFAVRLVFPFTQHKISLQLHVAMMGYMMVIKIIEVDISSVDLRKFFRTLYAAVHYLINNRVCGDVPCVSPTRSLSFVSENSLTPDNPSARTCV